MHTLYSISTNNIIIIINRVCVCVPGDHILDQYTLNDKTVPDKLSLCHLHMAYLKISYTVHQMLQLGHFHSLVTKTKQLIIIIIIIVYVNFLTLCLIEWDAERWLPSLRRVISAALDITVVLE